MKKLFLSFLMVLLSTVVNAVTIDGINYNLYSQPNTASVTNGDYSGAIVIPSEVSYNNVKYSSQS